MPASFLPLAPRENGLPSPTSFLMPAREVPVSLSAKRSQQYSTSMAKSVIGEIDGLTTEVDVSGLGAQRRVKSGHVSRHPSSATHPHSPFHSLSPHSLERPAYCPFYMGEPIEPAPKRDWKSWDPYSAATPPPPQSCADPSEVGPGGEEEHAQKGLKSSSTNGQLIAPDEAFEAVTIN